MYGPGRYVHFIMQLLDFRGQQEARVGEGTRIEFTRFSQSGGVIFTVYWRSLNSKSLSINEPFECHPLTPEFPWVVVVGRRP